MPFFHFSPGNFWYKYRWMSRSEVLKDLELLHLRRTGTRTSYQGSLASSLFQRAKRVCVTLLAVNAL